MNLITLGLVIVSSILLANGQTLGSYRIDRSKITVSGISSGAAMASQLHVAYSSTFSGSGSVAGPGYYCAGGAIATATSTCMSGYGFPTLAERAVKMLEKANEYDRLGQIDPLNNLKNQRVYFYSGSADYVVRPNVVQVGQDFFGNYTNRANLRGVYSYASTHGMITDTYGSSCGIISQYYINNCNYDQAHDMLSFLHPSDAIIKPNSGYRPTGTVLEFDQTEFFPTGTSSTIYMDKKGYIYVPNACKTQECKLHIALHGCLQGAYAIGQVFVNNAGYNQVADLNNFIVLYPQAVSSGYVGANPNGCWDWWGYTDANYANKMGSQMRAIRAMVERIAAN